MPSKRSRIPFPLSTSPGFNSQESQGRLINCYAEPLDESGKTFKWIRAAGLSQFVATAKSGYRGGLVVGNLSYEVFLNDACTVNASGSVNDLGAFPGSKKVSIARNQASPTPDVVAVDVDNGAYVLGSATVTAATATLTFSGSVLNIGDLIVLDFLNTLIPNFPINLNYAIKGTDTLTSIATKFESLINGNGNLTSQNISASSAGAVLTVSQQGAIGNSTSLLPTITAIGNAASGNAYAISISSAVSGTGNETVTISDEGILIGEANAATASLTISIGGTTFTAGDIVTLEFTCTNILPFPASVSYTLGASETAETVATGLTSAINANTTLAAVHTTGAATNNLIAVTQTLGTIAATMNPTSGQLAGGQGTYGAFTGSPTAYNGQGNLPAPNSVCFQDGYFFFTTAANKVYATGLNGLSMNALTYVTAQAKADVTLLRGIAFSGVLLLFTTGSCEVWIDAANPAPNFPYSRSFVMEIGLAQAAAIAGWETGFSQLLWVAQDFGVHWLPPGGQDAPKVSPPDLDRLIEAEIRAGNILEASCYVTQGKKFWVLSSPDWTWEFNLQTRKWNERQSLSLTNGNFVRWRGTGGHPAFGYWLMGDEQTGALLFIDDTNFSEIGATQLWRMESGPVSDFPDQFRIARADFNFVVGVGENVGTLVMNVTGAASGTNGVVRLTVNSTAQASTGDVCEVSNVVGTTEANGNWTIAVIDSTHIELQGTKFENAYTSGGIVVDLTVPDNVSDPNVAISVTKDGGATWGNPIVRKLGQQKESKRTRVAVMGMGLSSSLGDRWRMDITDPVYVSFLGAVQSNDPRYVGP